MSFIRTKDGIIYDLENKKVSSWEYIDNNTAINEYGVEGAFYTIYYFDENEGHYSEYDGKGGHSCDFIEEKDILNQADTIEELCDKFVITFNNKSLEPKQFKNFETALEFLKECDIKYNPELKGAIWTDKGLIYVAKMNSEGKLVLI